MYDVDFIQVLQASIAPCVMISGVGLLLLSFSNRLSRPLDRVRQLKKECEHATEEQKQIIYQQIDIFYHRCKLLRNAVAALTVSLFFIAVVILVIFISLTLHLEILKPIVRAGFVLSVLSILVGLVFFFWDIGETLRSIRLEIRQLKH